MQKAGEGRLLSAMSSVSLPGLDGDVVDAGNSTQRPLLSAIFIIDELPYLDCIPWRESAQSVLRFADELIVVHGGKRQPNGSQPAWDYFQSLRDRKVKLLRFSWPEKFDWRQIGRSCAFGHLHACGRWCFRVLADEVFPDDAAELRRTLEGLPSDIRIVSVARWYMLGCRYACAFNEKPLFFRNDRSVGYGTVNPSQGEAASYLLFDDPIETDLWFDGQDVVSIRDQSLLRDPDGLARLQGGETPRGYRGASTHAMTLRLNTGLFNVDVNFFPDSMLLDQKELSQQGYSALPPEYPHRPRRSRTELATALEEKVRRMILAQRLVRVELPEPLLAFMDRQQSITNRVRSVCEGDYGLPWTRATARDRAFRRLRTLTVNSVRTLIRRV